MATTVAGKVAKVEKIEEKLAYHVVARTGKATQIVLKVWLADAQGLLWTFKTPSFKVASDDWFFVSGDPRFVVGQDLTIRGTLIGTRVLNRVRRLWSDASPQTITAPQPVDHVGDLVDQYRTALEQKRYQDALRLAQDAQDAIGNQQRMLDTWRCILEDDLAFLVRQEELRTQKKK